MVNPSHGKTGFNPVTRSVMVAGQTVTYHDAGREHEDRAPIVLLHGTGGSTAAHFSFLFPMLATRHRVISIDLTCVATAPSPLSLEEFEEQLLAVLSEALPGRKITLLGYSLGAVLAAFVAARRPDTIENLVLIAGWAKTDVQQHLRNTVWQSLRAASSTALRDYMTYCAFSPRFLACRPVEEVEAIRNAVAVGPEMDRLMDLNRRIDLGDLVAAIRATTLVIGCRHDQMVPPHHSKALFGAIKNARYSEISSGHAVVFERPAELLRLVDAFASVPGKLTAGSIIPETRP